MNGVRIDSTSVLGDSLTVHYLSKEIIDSTYGCLVIGSSFLGDSIREGIDGRTRLYTFGGREIVIDRSLNIDESNVFYSFPNGNYLTASVISLGQDHFLDVTDSIKTFSLQLFDPGGNPVENPVNDRLIKISKSHGLIQFINLRDITNLIPDSPNYSLVANDSLFPEKYFLTYGDIYDFEVGDEFHYKNEDTGIGPSGTENVIRRILNKTLYPAGDSVRYDVYERKWGWKYISEDSSVYYQNEDEYEWVYTHLSQKLFSPELLPMEAVVDDDYVYNRLIYSNQDTYNGRYKVRKEGIQLLYNEGCIYLPADSYSGTFSYFIKGCGELFNRVYQEIVKECLPCEHLVYFLKNEETWGEPLAVQSHHAESYTVNLYPNPAKDRIIITSQNEISQVKLFNSTGKQFLLRSKIQSNVSECNISDFPAGIYIVLIETKPGSVVAKRLIIE